MPNWKIAIVVVVLSACSKGDDTAGTEAAAGDAPSRAAQSADAQLAEAGSYRLSMAKFDKWLDAQRNMARAAAAMSPEQMQAMEEAGALSELDANSIDGIAANVEGNPVILKAVRDAGLSPREYALVTASMMTASMASAMLTMRPDINQDSVLKSLKVDPANVEFIRTNEAEITRRQQALADEMRRSGG